MKGVKTGGRKKGTPNVATRDVQELVNAIFAKIDPVEKALQIFNSGNLKSETALLMRLLEYRYGKPVQPIAGTGEGGAIPFQLVSYIPRPIDASAGT